MHLDFEQNVERAINMYRYGLLRPEDVYEGWMEIHFLAINSTQLSSWITLLKNYWKMRWWELEGGGATKGDITNTKGN